MNQAQAARKPEEEPAANVKPGEQPGDKSGDKASRESETDTVVEQADLDEIDLDDEDDIGRRTLQILARVRERIREQPLTAASGAFILGFAFGNGVPKFVARAGIAIGLRLVMQRMFDRAELFEDEV